jgi:NADH-quinone oxidoreductase subunit C
VPVLEKVAPTDALERVTAALGDLAQDVKLSFGHVDVTCEPQNLVEAVTELRDADGIKCRFFTFLSGVDRSEFGVEEGSRAADEERGPQLEVLIHLYSPEYTVHTTIHVPLQGDRPTCASISAVFNGALWHERETHEMFGIHFEGHPHLLNLYLPEDFEGHPLLKSFKLPSRVVKLWPGAKDPSEAASGGRG